jgi:hypothetical protein
VLFLCAACQAERLSPCRIFLLFPLQQSAQLLMRHFAGDILFLPCAAYQLSTPYSYIDCLRQEDAERAVLLVGANLCARNPLQVKGKGLRGVGGEADTEAFSVHTKKLFPSSSTLQLAISFPVSICIWFTQKIRLFSVYPQASDVAKRTDSPRRHFINVLYVFQDFIFFLPESIIFLFKLFTF